MNITKGATGSNQALRTITMAICVLMVEAACHGGALAQETNGEVPGGPFACRRDNGVYYAVAEVINLQADGTYTYRSNRDPETTTTGDFQFDATQQVEFISGALAGISGPVAQDPENGSYYMDLTGGHGQCYIYEGELPF